MPRKTFLSLRKDSAPPGITPLPPPFQEHVFWPIVLGHLSRPPRSSIAPHRAARHLPVPDSIPSRQGGSEPAEPPPTPLFQPASDQTTHAQSMPQPRPRQKWTPQPRPPIAA